MLCIECGKREAKYDGLCEECFLKRVKFTELPRHIEIVVCPHCHSVKFGRHWESTDIEDAIYRIVDRSLRFNHEYDSYELQVSHGEIEGEFIVEAAVKIKMGDVSAEETHVVNMHIHHESCPRCNRFFGNYFEAILQVRGMREREISEVLNFVYERIEYHANRNENLFLTKEVEKKEGWDFYLSDKREAKKIAKEICHKYGASLKESPQLAGRKDGRDLYRVTYSVRLPDYRKGDVVEIEGEPYLVDSISGTYIRGISLKDGRHKRFDSKRHSIKLLVKSDEFERAIVVYSRGEETQLLDSNNTILELRTPLTLKDGSTVKIARVGDDVYVLPE